MRPKQPSEELILLKARAADDATEVFIADGQFRRIAQGVGSVDTAVTPGIYKVRFRSGDTQHDELVEVGPDDQTIEVLGPRLMFRSAVPMTDTETLRATHAEAAENLSTSVPESFGLGSQLFVFIRSLEPLPERPSWSGVSLRWMDGDFLADFEVGVTDANLGYGGLHVELDPGTYRLRVETGMVGDYEMFVTTAQGWQTQVFVLSDEFWTEGRSFRRASLRDAAVLMRPEGMGFLADNEQARLTELARQGLESGRIVVRAEDLHDMLWAKEANPMVAIYGAHLMLLQPRIDHDLLEMVIQNLENLIGPHPDVSALLLRPGAGTPPAGLQFPEPPMLRDSWDLISRASLRRIALVPAGSSVDRIADHLLGSRPWLLHRVDEVEAVEDVDVSFAAATRMIDSLIERGVGGEAESLAKTIVSQPKAFSPLEQSIASVTIGGALLERTEEIKTAEVQKGREPGPSVGQVLRSLDAPATSIARSIVSLVRKLEVLS